MRTSRFRFGSFELDSASKELRKNGLRIHIEEQPAQILHMLVARPGDVVTREELKDALWADDTHVDFDRSLNRAVNKVRVAINDSAANPRYIETLPKRGYRFIAPITQPVEEKPAPMAAKRPQRGWWAAAAATILAFTGIAWIAARQSPARQISSVAVLPLENLSGDTAQSYFSVGMTDQLIAVLSRFPSLRVVSLKSVLRYKDTRKELAEIARELNVDAIVDGSVARVGDRVRINARLIQFPGERAVLTKSYERGAVEVLSLQSELARNIADEIGATIRPEDEARLASISRPVDPKLHSLYLRGRFFANEGAREPLERAVAIMEKVVAEDPRYAPAYSTAADAWFNISNVHTAPNLAMPKANVAARKAIELDPQSDSARSIMGLVHLFYDWDLNRAGAEFQKALDINPNSAEAYRGLAFLRLAKGEGGLALDASKKAAQLSPRSLWIRIQSALIHLFAERNDEAIQEARSTLEWEPGFGLMRSILGLAYVQQGQIGDGIRELEAGVQSQRIPTTVGFLAIGYALAGRRAQAEATLSQLVALSNRQYVCAFEVAGAFAALGRSDEAFEWMNRGVADRADCMLFLHCEPWLKSIRGDRRYAALVRRIGLPERAPPALP